MLVYVSRPKYIVRAVTGAGLLILAANVWLLFSRGRVTPQRISEGLKASLPSHSTHFAHSTHSTHSTETHPIQRLMSEARDRHRQLLGSRSTDIQAAAARYRASRGRHPPPGFDKWFAAAMASDVIVVEDYFDRIYKDLGPFWALDPVTLKKRASWREFGVRVRNGKVTGRGHEDGMLPVIPSWSDLISEFSEHLPDLDMPCNNLDETRVTVPFGQMAALMSQEVQQRTMPKPSDVTTQFKGLADIDKAGQQGWEPNFLGGDDTDIWDLTARACGPETPARDVRRVQDFSAPAPFPLGDLPAYAPEGFIRNWTAAKDVCHQPHMRQLHGSFVRPASQSMTDELIPIFSSCKLGVNNDIVIPGAMYVATMESYSGGEDHGPPWLEKNEGMMWRGSITGGSPGGGNWHRFQRHRFVDMVNGTKVAWMESTGKRHKTFQLPLHPSYQPRRIRPGQLGSWLQSFADVSFAPCGGCEYYDGADYSEGEKLTMRDQYNFKFLPDIDGNSYSARWRGFLRSTSVPMKATLYHEWHDDRLVPWLHFVPMDMTYQDVYGILDFFGDKNGPGDHAAAFIAENSREWSDRVLRREDMRLYVWRLLLEWARVCDENRHQLGFVDDLPRDAV